MANDKQFKINIMETNDNEKAPLDGQLGLMNLYWRSPEEKPQTFEPILVAGTLCNEGSPAAHEGFWDGKRWKSIRDSGDGFRTLRIDDVVAWMAMPALPLAPLK